MFLDGLDVVDMRKVFISGLVSGIRTNGLARSGIASDAVEVSRVDVAILRCFTELEEARHGVGVGGVLIDLAGRTLRDGDGKLQVVSNAPDAMILETTESEILHSLCQLPCGVFAGVQPV